MNNVRCLLLTQRKKWGLSQNDLAALIPGTGRNRVSCIERGLSSPNAREILAYRLIFGTLPEELFPGLVAQVEEAVLRKAYELHEKLATQESPSSAQVRSFLEAILARAVEAAGQQEI
jgi:transcriptional regulator with XRE-family HTH domain